MPDDQPGTGPGAMPAPRDALAALRAAAARDGPLPLERRTALLESLAVTLLREADAIAAAIDSSQIEVTVPGSRSAAR